MRVRMVLLAGTTALALAASGALAPGAGASITPHPSASLAAGYHGKATAPAKIALTGKCKTAFGTPLPTPDGIISWEVSGFDVAGAADFKCGKNLKKKARTFTTVTVNGYFGDADSTTFDVTLYADLNGEPDNNSPPTCPTQSVIGSPTGSVYPTNDTTVITLTTPCLAHKGVNWLEVQAVSDNAWYWEVQQEQHKNQADWRDTNNAFGTPCTPGYQDGFYMQDCIFGSNVGENDFMFVIS